MEGGVLENYIHNNGNNVDCGIYIKGGTVQNLDLTKYNGTSYILGGSIEGGTMAGGTLSDVDANDPEMAPSPTSQLPELVFCRLRQKTLFSATSR